MGHYFIVFIRIIRGTHTSINFQTNIFVFFVYYPCIDLHKTPFCLSNSVLHLERGRLMYTLEIFEMHNCIYLKFEIKIPTKFINVIMM